MRWAAIFLAALLTLGLGEARAGSVGEGVVALKNFRFGDGSQLATLNLHYRTLGTAVRDSTGHITNAVLLLHGTTGTADTMLAAPFRDALYGVGKSLDAERLFIVIPDGIGAGGSSKPSDGLRARFPHYGYKDQVRAQRAMLMDMGIEHLKLVLGTSMGGMQTVLWGETYPRDVDALVAIACTPAAISGRNMMWRAMIMDAIRNDPDWRGGDYPVDKPPRAWGLSALPLFRLMTGNVEELQKQGATRAKAIALVHEAAARAAKIDANDFLYTYDSSADYDPAPQLGAITKPMLAINFADDLLNPPELLAWPDRSNVSKVLLPGGYGHQTLTHPDLWAPTLTKFLSTLSTWR